MAQISQLTKKPVYIYTSQLPYPTGSGSKVRIYTNARAYIDLGFRVEIVHMLRQDQWKQHKPQYIHLPIQISKVELTRQSSSAFNRFAHYFGFPTNYTLNYMFPERYQIQAEVLRRENLTPEAIHQFEYLHKAIATVGLKGNFIWSAHDIESDRHLKVQAMRRLKVSGYSDFHNWLKIRRLRWAEWQTAQSCRLVLTIADHETKELRQRWRDQRVQFFPMSWPDEKPAPRLRDWGEGGRLKLLHLGNVDAMIPYYSMKFLLEDVFPLIPTEIMKRMDLLVVGHLGEGGYCKEIQHLASNYPNISFLGYQADLLPFFGEADLQVVGSLVATGLRTRIIESFVRGLPVLSTSIAAEGIAELSSDHNIILANDALSYSSKLIELLNNPQQLQYIALNALNTYQKNNSRKVATNRLGELLETYL